MSNEDVKLQVKGKLESDHVKLWLPPYRNSDPNSENDQLQVIFLLKFSTTLFQSLPVMNNMVFRLQTADVGPKICRRSKNKREWYLVGFARFTKTFRGKSQSQWTFQRYWYSSVEDSHSSWNQRVETSEHASEAGHIGKRADHNDSYRNDYRQC